MIRVLFPIVVPESSKCRMSPRMVRAALHCSLVVGEQHRTSYSETSFPWKTMKATVLPEILKFVLVERHRMNYSETNSAWKTRQAAIPKSVLGEQRRMNCLETSFPLRMMKTTAPLKSVLVEQHRMSCLGTSFAWRMMQVVARPGMQMLVLAMLRPLLGNLVQRSWLRMGAVFALSCLVQPEGGRRRSYSATSPPWKTMKKLRH
jgi:hypothetical protein